MDTRSTTVSQAFPERIQYVVPSYQRNYVWTKEDQWEPLWEDILEVTRRDLDNETHQVPHFLGTIITKPVTSGQSRLERWSVVDGQQRLTTLQLLIAAVHWAFTRYELPDHASMLAGYLTNKRQFVQENQETFKIRHKSRDYRGFAAVIELSFVESTREQADSTQSKQLFDCYEHFRQAACKWLQSHSDKPLDVRAEALTKAIMDKLHFVEIRLKHENSHSIFEALNARGEPLTEWEKTKNYMLSIAVSEDDPDGDRAYTDHLEPYDSDVYWNQIVSATRFTGKRIDFFLFFFAQIEIPRRRQKALGGSELRTLQRNRLYRDFRYVGEHLYRRDQKDFDGLLHRLKRYAEIYERIDRKDDKYFSEYARLVMHRRETLNLASLIPVFMVLIERLGYGEDLDQSLRVVDSYLMRRVALKANYSGFDDVAFGYVQAIRDAPPGDVVAVLIELFEKSTWANRWPGDEEIMLHLREADMYHGVSSARKQLLLRGVAQKMHEEREQHLTMSFSPDAILTVEHVAPVGWERHWKEDLKFGDSDEDRQRLNRVVHRIGNLTIVTKALNNKLLNHPWSHKAALLKDDNLEMNSRLLNDMEGSIWNEEEVKRRSKIIAENVNKIWPHSAVLREELGIAPSDDKTPDLVSGISPLVAERFVDSVTETGVEDGWADTDRLNRYRRDGRYGRYLQLGGGGHWKEVWFGVSTRDRQLVLNFGDPEEALDYFIEVPEGVDLDEALESVTTEVRKVAATIAADAVVLGQQQIESIGDSGDIALPPAPP